MGFLSKWSAEPPVHGNSRKLRAKNRPRSRFRWHDPVKTAFLAPKTEPLDASKPSSGGDRGRLFASVIT